MAGMSSSSDEGSTKSQNKNLTEGVTSPSSGVASSSGAASSEPSRAGVSTKAQLGDGVSTTVIPKAPGSPGSGDIPLGIPVSRITDPTQAVAALKGKVSILHKVVNDVTHHTSLNTNDLHSLMADIMYLSSVISSKS